MAEALDLARPLSELLEAHPTLGHDLEELGISADRPEETLPELARRLDVSLSIIAIGLEASGYDVQGYSAEDDAGSGASPLPDLVAALFGVDRDGNPLPDPDFSQESLCATELGHEPAPLLLHMEDAIRHAQEDGVLPADAAARKDGQKNA